MKFSSKNRPKIIEKLKTKEYDLLIIGGGITGAGLSVQATSMGMSTALIEMQDFSEGTSSRSTKMVHGGIRYLRAFDVATVRDTLAERAVVQGIAPHIPRPVMMLLPIYDEADPTFDPFNLKVAMDLYDKLAGVLGTKYANKLISKEEALAIQPNLNPENLLGAGVYLDYTNNDSRLVIENIKEAAERGADTASRVKAIEILHDKAGIVNGVLAEDLTTNERFEIHAKVVINAAGPFVDQVGKLDSENDTPQKMQVSKGVHLVVDESVLKVDRPTYVDTGKQDGRMTFIIPREHKTYFGTTDTVFDGDLKDPRVTQEDVDYLLSVINKRFPKTPVKQSDIETGWAGVRPLLSSNRSSDYNGGTGNKGKVTPTSFRTLLAVIDKFENNEATKEDVEKVIGQLKTAKAENQASNSQILPGTDVDIASDHLVTLSGGKITEYRLMAEKTLAIVLDKLLAAEKDNFAPIDSKELQVSGGHFDAHAVDQMMKSYAKMAELKGLSPKEAEYLAHKYGSNTKKLLRYLPKAGEVAGLNTIESISLLYALDNEMIMTPTDYLLRRTNFMLFNLKHTLEMLEPVVNQMAKYYQWDDATKEKMLAETKAEIAKVSLADLKK